MYVPDGSTRSIKEMTHPLNELFELYEAVMQKPELKEPGSAAIGTPQANYDEHPVIQDKNKVDAL